jgi:hypothetical protein
LIPFAGDDNLHKTLSVTVSVEGKPPLHRKVTVTAGLPKTITMTETE